jgi:hypothetical protein
MRLLVWGREWGIVEGKLEAHLQAGNENLRALAVQILTELHRTITDFRKLKDRNGLKEEVIGEGNEKAVEKRKEEARNGVGRLKNELQLRAKWVIADKDKFTILLMLRDLKDFNDGLEQIFPRVRLAILQRTWTKGVVTRCSERLRKVKLVGNSVEWGISSIKHFGRPKTTTNKPRCQINRQFQTYIRVENPTDKFNHIRQGLHTEPGRVSKSFSFWS